jgi:hypothetical protein
MNNGYEADKRISSYDFLWLGIALLPLLGISFMLAIQPQDYWWVLRVGQETLQNGAIPATDTISLSQLHQPIIYQTWLSGIIFWLVYKTGGISLTFLLRGILIGVAYGVIWRMARDASNAWLATILVFVFGIAGANNWSVRSQLFGYPLFACCLWILNQWQKGENRYLWGLPLCTLLWANMHGSFILPIVLSGAALVFGKGSRKLLFSAAGAALVITLLNPHGLGVWKYFFSMLNSPSDQFFAFEWAPPRNEGWQMNIFFASLLAFPPLAALSPRKLSALDWVWFIGFGWLALTGLRYVVWFLFIVIILLASLLADWAAKLDKPRQTFHALNIGFGIFMLAISLIFLPGIREKWMTNSVPVFEMETTPLAATKWLTQHPKACSTLWADYAFGGYLAFAMPSCHSWMDSRFNAFPPEQWSEYVQASRAENWQEFFDSKGIQHLMLSTAAQPKLVEAVSASDVWQKIYEDQYAVIFSRFTTK